MQEALSISPVAWGWVTGAFTLAYAAFEIPSGTLKMVPPMDAVVSFCHRMPP